MRLGDYLLQEGLISKDQIDIALIEQKKTNRPLGEIFVDLGFVTASIIRDILDESQGQDSVSLESAVPDLDAIALVPKAIKKVLSSIVWMPIPAAIATLWCD